VQLTVRELSRWFNVPESTVIRWVRNRNLPAQRIAGQHRFNRAEVLEWATTNQIKISPDVIPADRTSNDRAVGLLASLTEGGVFHGVPGQNKEQVFRAIVERLPLQPETDRELLLHLFLAREASASTALGSGIAIPHVRNPIIEPIGRPLVSLALLAQPIEFGAPDGQPVHTIFTIISPTPRGHIQMLSRLALVLHDGPLCDALIHQAPVNEILQTIGRIEDSLADSASRSGKEID